jgi:hypothetical protein
VVTNEELERARNLINENDFTFIVNQLVLVNKWSKKQALEACQQYRNYLFLKKKYGNQYELPPSLDIDQFWHTHILYTKNYDDFCKKIFGSFLHHHPTTDESIKISIQQYERMFEEQTQKLYIKEFGEYIYAIRPLSIS